MSFAGIIKGPFLGQGGYGEVYKIQYKGKNCALKILESQGDVGLPELSELNALSNIKHPNLIELIDFRIEGNRIGFILPLAKYDLFQAVKNPSNRVFIDKWIYEILSAVFFLHKNGFYHCDIKLSNILIMDDNRACIADFGLVRRAHISSKDVCQSLTSPQLLERRVRSHFDWRAFKEIVNQPSNEFQDDIWAVGFTIYLILKSYYPQRTVLKFNDHGMYYLYMMDVNFFEENGMPPKYASLLMVLMNPDAFQRSINLNMLLGTPALKGYDRYIDGEIVKVVNNNPVTEKELSILPKFLKDAIEIMASFGVEDYVYIQLIDLCYRCISFCITKALDLKKLTVAIVIILANVDKLDSSVIGKIIYKNFHTHSEFIFYESELLNYLEGHVTREIFADYIDKSKYSRCIEWIIANPDKYEIIVTPILVQMFNAMFS